MKLEKIVRWGIYIIALVPLIIFKDFLSPFHFGKVIVFRIFIEILLLFYLALAMQDRSFFPKSTPLVWAVTIFTAVFGITSLTSTYPYQSFIGTLERMGGWFTLAHFWIFFMIIVSVMRTKEDWIKLLQVSVIGAVWSMFYGFLQKTGWDFIVGGEGRIRIFGTIGNTALFAGYMIVNVFFALILIVHRALISTEKFFKLLPALIPIFFISWLFTFDAAHLVLSFFTWGLYVLFLAAMVAIAYGVYYLIAVIVKLPTTFSFAFNIIAFVGGIVAVAMTAVRGSILGLLVSFALFSVFYSFIAASKRMRGFLFATITLLIVLEGILIAAHNTDFVKRSGYLTRLSDVSLSTRTVDTRFWAWRAGIDGWNDSVKTILLGWGPENFNIPFSKHFNPEFFTNIGSETLFDRAHNMFVEVLVTMGIAGFVSYVALFVVMFWMLYRIYHDTQERQERMTAIVFVCGIIAYCIHNMFIFDTSANFIVFFMMAGFLNYLFVNRHPQNGKAGITSLKPLPVTLRYSVVLLFSVAAVFSIVKTDIRPAKANYITTRAIVASWANDHVKAIEKFEQALSYDTFPAYELRHRYAQYVLESYGKFSAQKIDPGKSILRIIEHVKMNLDSPQDYLPYLYISRAYIILGKNDPKSPFNDLALENSLKAQEISPTFIRTYYEIAQAYINKKEYDKAIGTFNEAISLNPDVGISWWYLASTQFEAGKFEDGFASVQKAISFGYDINNETDLNRLISIYAKMQNFKKVAELFEQVIVLNPKNPQYYASLATTYARIGRIADAVRQAKLAAQLDPAFEPEARGFVNQIGGTW